VLEHVVAISLLAVHSLRRIVHKWLSVTQTHTHKKTDVIIVFLAPQIVIQKSDTKIFESVASSQGSIKKNHLQTELCLEFSEGIPVSGDIRIALINKPKVMKKVRNYHLVAVRITEMAGS